MKTSTKKKIASLLRFVFHTDDTPTRAALAFALGVFVGWTPALGLHTLIAVGLAFLLGLNRIAVMAGTLINNPWTFVPIYSASAYCGAFLLGSNPAPVRFESLASWEGARSFFGQLGPWIVPLSAGTLVLGAGCALLSFPIVLYGILWYRTLRRAG
jgi:hypothetical protein